MLSLTPARLLVRLAVTTAVLATAACTLVGGGAGVDATVDPNAWYVLRNRHSGKVMDVLGSTADGNAAVGQWSRNDGVRQQFQLVASGDGTYRLRSRESGRVVDVEGRSRTDGARLVQRVDANRSSQRWRLVDVDGHVQLVNRNSGKVLEVWEWATGDGARLAQYTDLDGANQQWELIRLDGGGGPGPTDPWPTPRGEVRITSTREVSGTFDGGLQRYSGIGDGGQGEDQDPMFRLADGATLRNVIIGAPAGDGVHCAGSCTLTNVWWEDVGEDAATFRGGASVNATVDGGGARSASDKVFQHNGGGTLTIRDFQVSDFGKLYRSCGNCGTQYRRTVVVRDVVVTAPGDALVGINENYGDTATLSGLTIVGDAGRDISICDRYIGNDSGDEPRRSGSGADGTFCRYDPAAITYR